MRLRFCVLALALLVVPATPAAAAPIFIFEVAGAAGLSTDSIQSFAFTQQGAGGTLEFTKEVDAASINLAQAVAQGTLFSSAAFIAYDTVISPQSELFRYTLNDLVFTSFFLNGLTETVSLMAATATLVPAGGATLFTFGVDGTTIFDTTTINSFAFFQSGAGGTLNFTKEIDSASDDIAQAVAQGSLFAGATFIGYDGVISPEAEVFRYLLTNILFTSVTLNQLTETVSLQAEGATLIDGPASVPEPGLVPLLLTAAAVLLRRARRNP